MTALVVTLGAGEILRHYDVQADIAWLRFEDHDAAVVVAEEADFGLHELDRIDRHVVGLEYWHASQRLPADLLRMLPGAAGRRRSLSNASDPRAR